MQKLTKKIAHTLSLFAVLFLLANPLIQNSRAADDDDSTEAPEIVKPKSKSKPRYQRRYGMAGCGAWTYVFKEDTREKQIFHSVAEWGIGVVPIIGGTIALFTAPSWAMSTGTSNCVERDEVVAMEQKVYLENNLASVSKEAAFGAGEHLEALSEVLGCSNKLEFNQFTQRNFGTIFQDQDSVKILERLFQTLKLNPELEKTCRYVG